MASAGPVNGRRRPCSSTGEPKRHHGAYIAMCMALGSLPACSRHFSQVFHRTAERFDGVQRLAGISSHRVPTVRVASGSATRGRALAADPNGRARSLYGFGLENHILERNELTVVVCDVVFPQTTPRFDVLVGRSAASVRKSVHRARSVPRASTPRQRPPSTARRTVRRWWRAFWP